MLTDLRGWARGGAPWLLVAAGLVLAAWLHRQAGFAFPPPWNDEAHFLVPALELVRHGSLSPPLLNAAEGIFWLPHGYYVAMSPLAMVAGDVLAVARWASFAGVVVFAGSMGVVGWRRGMPPGLAILGAAAWLALPRVVLAGNVARMEALILAVAGAALVAAERDRWVAAVAVAAAASLLHPIGVIPFIAVCAGAIVSRRDIRIRPLDKAVAGVVALLVIAQALYLVTHAHLVAEHLGFQLQRKVGREPLLTLPILMVLGAAGAGVIVLLRRIIPPPARTPLSTTLWTLAAGLLATALVGQEIWYEVLGVEAAAALLVLSLLISVPRWSVTAQAVAGAALVGAGALAAVMTLHGTVQGFSVAPDSHTEWRGVVDDTIRALEDYDAAPGPAQLVVLDPLSSFAHEVHGREWSRLTFRQPTPVTPIEPSEADLWLVGPTEKASLQFGDWAAGAPIIQERSPSGRLQFIVFSASASE